MNEDKSTHPRHMRSEAGRMAPRSAAKIVNSDKSGQATKVRKKPWYSLASQLFMDQSHENGNPLQETTQRKNNFLLFGRGKKSETHTPTYTDVEWRQWRSEPQSSEFFFFRRTPGRRSDSSLSTVPQHLESLTWKHEHQGLNSKSSGNLIFLSIFSFRTYFRCGFKVGGNGEREWRTSLNRSSDD